MRWTFVVVVLTLAAVAGFAPIDSGVVERWYSTGIYPVIQRALTPVSNLVPFAVLDVLAVGAFCAVVVTLVRSVFQARKKRTWKPIVVTFARLVTAGAIVYLVFLAVWGLNYRRVSMTERLVLDRAASPEAIMALGRTAVQQLNGLHAAAHAEGWRTSPWRERRMRDAFDVGSCPTLGCRTRRARPFEVIALRAVLPVDQRGRHDQPVRPRGDRESGSSALRTAVSSLRMNGRTLRDTRTSQKPASSAS